MTQMIDRWICVLYTYIYILYTIYRRWSYSQKIHIIRFIPMIHCGHLWVRHPQKSGKEGKRLNTCSRSEETPDNLQSKASLTKARSFDWETHTFTQQRLHCREVGTLLSMLSLISAIVCTKVNSENIPCLEILVLLQAKVTISHLKRVSLIR